MANFKKGKKYIVGHLSGLVREVSVVKVNQRSVLMTDGLSYSKFSGGSLGKRNHWYIHGEG